MNLLDINVNEHTEKKNGLTYLSWAWAWAEVLKIDAEAYWQAHEWNGMPAMFLPDGSAMVKVSTTIKGDTKTCPLPVMDHRNKAIKNPDAFAINTATMRALAKSISMHGLGLYIYAGEDLPEGAEPEPPKPEAKRTTVSPADKAKQMTADAVTNLQRVVDALVEMETADMDKIWPFIPPAMQDKILAVWPATA